MGVPKFLVFWASVFTFATGYIIDVRTVEMTVNIKKGG